MRHVIDSVSIRATSVRLFLAWLLGLPLFFVQQYCLLGQVQLGNKHPFGTGYLPLKGIADLWIWDSMTE